jgi:prephenate dehydrogenase
VVDIVATRPEEALTDADLVVLAAPAPDCLAMLDDLAGAWHESLAADAVVTDVASTKRAIVLRATALGLRFVGGHPMAGRETAGYGSADAGLFAGRPWVVVPGTDPAALGRVESLARATGATPIRLGAGEHDAAVAAISHLPLVVAASLVEAMAMDGGDWTVAASLAASGWRDTTRVARGDAAMGAGIVLTNADAIAARLDTLIATLEGWREELRRPGGPDPDVVSERLRQARAVLEGMPG